MHDITPSEEKTLRQDWLAKSNRHHFVTMDDARYPALLKETVGAPTALYVYGDCAVLSQAQIAMVGSRNPSHAGLELAQEFAFGLSQAGLCITSGMAIGIDTASHEGALRANGKTIAVLGSGLLQLYPKRNRALAEKISERGCVISEWPLNTEPLRANFPQRNRIISGLSLGTMVVEAALQSGSLITAKMAAEQNRDVFAIPGSLRNPTAKGCLTLIQQGAKCVMCVEDILEEYRARFAFVPCLQDNSSNENTTRILNKKNANVIDGIKQDTKANLARGLDPSVQQVLACIESDVTSVDQICIRSKLSAQIVTSCLLQLEIDGVVKIQHGGYIKNE